MHFSSAFAKMMALGFSLLVLASTPAVAASVHGVQFQDWRGRCERAANGQVCYVEQVVGRGGQVLMTAVIGYAPSKRYPTLFFELPAGINVDAGVSMRVDQGPLIKFKGRCAATMCTAGFTLKPELLTQVLKGTTAVIVYSAPSGQQYSLPLSLKGVSAGMRALR